jgi:hypothetical protein
MVNNLIFDENGNKPNYTSEYKYTLFKNIGWRLNDIFKNKGDQLKQSAITGLNQNIRNDMTSRGHRKNAPDTSAKAGMWNRERDGQDPVHYFDKLYHKISCCLGGKKLRVPYIKSYTPNGTPIKDELLVDFGANAQTCTIQHVNWWDTNNIATPTANARCLDLFRRLIAFLKLYDPTNEMVKKFGGCLDDDQMPPGAKKSNAVYLAYDANRKSYPACSKDTSFKRSQDRPNVEQTICAQSVDFENVKAGRDFLAEVDISCGKDTPIGKKLDELRTADDAAFQERARKEREEQERKKQEEERKRQEQQKKQGDPTRPAPAPPTKTTASNLTDFQKQTQDIKKQLNLQGTDNNVLFGVAGGAVLLLLLSSSASVLLL